MTSQSPRLICHVTPYYPPHIGGLEVVAETIATLLSEDRQVQVLTSRAAPSPAPRAEVRGNLRVRRLATVEFAHVPIMPTLIAHLARLPREAVVHVHVAVAYASEVVWLYSKLTRRPYVAHFHLDVDPSGFFGPVFVLYKRLLLGRVLRTAARVIAVSPDQPEFLARVHGVRRDRIALIPNGVGPEFFLPAREQPGRDRKFRLLLVGRLAPQKRIDLLLRALALVRQPMEVAIVGDGEDRAKLQRLADTLGLSDVRLVGAKVGSELVDQYRWADAFVLTSVKESTGLVILEAFAAGLPVVAADAVGVRDTVGTDGWLVPPDPASLAQALDRLAGDPDAWQDLAARSAERAHQHPWAPQVEALTRLYDQVYGPDGSPARRDG